MATITRVDGVLFKRALGGSKAWLSANKERVNQLNVFPVPDGDTGTNMLLTLESALDEVAADDTSDLSQVAGRVAHGALMGARGNSGVILSQVLRGFSQGVGDATSVDCRQLARAFEEATSVAYRGVNKPTEGTILTVARKVSEAAALRADTTDVTEFIQAIVGAAQRAVDETPSQLAVLREAGVVDAGGYGLMIILEGFLKTVKGQEIPGAVSPLPAPREPVAATAKIGAHALEAPEEGWGFCTEFLIERPARPFEVLREELTPLGNSAVIVGDDELVRVHIHTLDPGSLIAHATAFGTLQKLKVEDMTRQHHEILSSEPVALEPPPGAAVNGTGNGAVHLPNGRLGVVAVAVGDGFRKIFEDLGAAVVEGGQTMNPSTEDLLQAVNAVPAGKVIILPNNKNVIMTAQQVQGLCDKEVRVVPSSTVPQGIAALLTMDPEGEIDGATEAMTESLEGVQTIEVTTAVRTTSVDGLKIRNGDSIALVNGKIKAAGKSSMEVIDGALEKVDPANYELVTMYAGEGVDDAQLEEAAEHIRERYPALSVEVQRGEQSHYPFILSLE